MGFLDKLRDRRNYTDANIYEFERRPSTPIHIGPNPGSNFGWGTGGGGGISSSGLIDRIGQSVGRQSQRPMAGGGGGNADGSPNVVYDPGPEQFEKRLKLERDQLDNSNRYRDAALANETKRAEAAMMNAEALSGYRGTQSEIARYKAMNPNHLIRETPSGYIAIDPVTNEVVSLGARGMGMAKEDEINLRNRGALEQIGLRNEGSMDVQALRNSGALELLGIRNQAQLDRLMRTLEANKNNTIFRTNANTWETRVKEGLIDPNDPVEGRVPTYPRGDINLPGGPAATPPMQGPPEPNRPAINSLGGTSSSMQSPINSLQLSPQQYSSFSAKPGQYTAAPGQFTAGTPAAEIAAKGGNPAELRAQAEEYLKSQGKPVTENNLAYVMQQLQQKQQQSQQGGTATTGTPQASGGSRYGTVTPLGTALKH